MAIVTGGASGIGGATSRRLAEEGAKVLVTDVDIPRAEANVARIRDAGGTAEVLRADVGKHKDIRNIVQTAMDHWGRLDIVVNNAAVGRLSLVEEASDEDLATQVGVNVLGPLYVVRAAVPHLRAAGGGDIVNVSSDSVDRPFPFLVTYAATKGALETLTEGLREELAPDGIRVTIVRSGPALTSFAADWEPEAAARAFTQWQTEARLDPTCVVSPEAVAAGIRHVLSQPREATVHLLDIRPSRGGR